MSKETLRDKLQRALIQRGEVVVKSKSSKYVTMTARLLGEAPVRFFFIGKAGALRQGPVSSKSFPVTSTLREQLLKGQ